ncbi:hypothetical protein RBB50_000796 [Rhinocladiella similis]
MGIFKKIFGFDKPAVSAEAPFTVSQLKAHGLILTPGEDHIDKLTCRHCHVEMFNWADRSDYAQELSILPWLHDQDCQKHASKLPLGVGPFKIYDQLKQDGSQIRLLQLHARGPSLQIQCSLRTVDRSAKPVYHALSYCWGTVDGTRPYFIVLNNQTWRITPNLFHALKALQNEDDPRDLWVDALCINQFDDQEKTQQVKLMADIYKDSTVTQIWLNEPSISVSSVPMGEYVMLAGSEHDSSIIDRYVHRHVDFDQNTTGQSEVLERMGESCGCCRDQPVFETLKDEHYLGAICLLSHLAVDKHLHELPYLRANEHTVTHCSEWPSILLAINAIVLNPWFERVWVIQEAVLSPKSLVHFGRFKFPFDMLLRAQSNSEKHKRNCCSTIFLRMPFMQQNIFKMLNEKAGYFKPNVSEHSISLTRTVWHFMRHQSKDPRDKVFGVLSLMSDEYRKCIGGLLPNYKLNLSQSYTLAANFMIDEVWDGRSLRMLTLVRKSNCRRLGLPSWVPDWSDEDPHWSPRLFFSRSYRASGETTHKPKAHTRFLALGNSGIDRVSKIGPRIQNFQSGKCILETIKTWFRVASELLSASTGTSGQRCECGSTACKVPSPKDRQRAFYRTLLCDLTRTRIVPGLSHLPRATEEDVDAVDELLSWGEKHPNSFDLEHVPDHLRLTLNELISSLYLRRFFVTEMGLFGLGPIEMRTGDEARIVFGSDVPMIVRPIKNFFLWRYELGGIDADVQKSQNDVSEISCQDYLSSCVRERLKRRAAVFQSSSQEYAPFVAAAFTDWHLPSATDPNASNIVFDLGHRKALRLMHLARDSVEVEGLVEYGIREYGQIFGKVSHHSDRKLRARAHKMVQNNLAAIAGKQEAPGLFDAVGVAWNQTHTLVGDCYLHGIMDGEMMVGFENTVLDGDPIRAEVTPYDRIVLG